MAGSWTDNEQDRDAWAALAAQIETVRLDQVRYVAIDYRRHEVAPDLLGPRQAEDESEWADPPWQFPGGHNVDFGVELLGVSGELWSIGWTTLGSNEGLAISEGPLLGGLLEPDAPVVIWDVGRTEWSPFLGETVNRVTTHYQRWGDTECWWCPQLDLEFRTGTVEILEAQGNPDGSISPSASNLIVRFRLH